MQDIIIQRVVFPEDEKHEANWELFYHAPRLIIREEGLFIPENTIVDFASYLNGCPVNKWAQYTNLQNLQLNLTITGNVKIVLTGYSLMPTKPVRKVYLEKDCSCNEEQCIVMEYPNILSDTFLAFELIATGPCVLREAYYSTRYEKSAVRPVNLCIATTTFKREEYIIKNISKLRKELLEGENEIKDHLFINVIDNGRTLKKEEIEAEHIRLYDNDNAGGSGGFARGMLEALHMEPEITHVLLMDDDVLVLPESIRRTYILLQLVKDEFKDAFVSGAMLEMDSMYTMHEDIGLLKEDKSFFHAKPVYNVKKLTGVMKANAYYPYHKNQYAGWWYCCIPVASIRKFGLPLPLFIRGDDVEYGIRCQPKIMTMTGICIWHLSFEGKYSAGTNLYQEFRNILIVKDATQKIPEVDVFGRWKRECQRAALTFDYDGWELLLLAIEDYMKGPAFIARTAGTEILQRNKAFSEKMEPLSEIDTPDFYLDQLYEDDPPLSLLQKIKYYFSYNGQVGHAGKNVGGTGLMMNEWDHKPGKNMFKKEIFVVDPVNRTGCLRKRNEKRFRELKKRQDSDTKRYFAQHGKLEKAYIEAYPVLTSEAFWKQYLKL